MTEYFKLIVITPEKSVSEESVLINNLFEAGLKLLHIRKPFYDIAETKKLINSISIDFHSHIVIHNHYKLLHDFNLKGAHLSEKVRREKPVNNAGKIISTSFHSLEDIHNEDGSFEYAFLSPVFPSISKQGYKPSLNTQQIKEFFASPVAFPVVALSGITDENIRQVSEMGFGGAAFIGYIWDANDPVKQFKKLKKVVTANY